MKRKQWTLKSQNPKNAKAICENNENNNNANNNSRMSRIIPLADFSVCVFFNQKPQIAATQKMTINHPQDARSQKWEQDLESQDADKVPGRRVLSPRLLSNTFNAWPKL